MALGCQDRSEDKAYSDIYYFIIARIALGIPEKYAEKLVITNLVVYSTVGVSLYISMMFSSLCASRVKMMFLNELRGI